MWIEGKKEEEGVLPCSWVDEERKCLFRPPRANAQTALSNQEELDEKSWRQFQLGKV